MVIGSGVRSCVVERGRTGRYSMMRVGGASPGGGGNVLMGWQSVHGEGRGAAARKARVGTGVCMWVLRGRVVGVAAL